MKNELIVNDEGKAVGMELVSASGARVTIKDTGTTGKALVVIDPPGELTPEELIQLSIVFAMVAKMNAVKASVASALEGSAAA